MTQSKAGDPVKALREALVARIMKVHVKWNLSEALLSRDQVLNVIDNLFQSEAALAACDASVLSPAARRFDAAEVKKFIHHDAACDYMRGEQEQYCSCGAWRFKQWVLEAAGADEQKLITPAMAEKAWDRCNGGGPLWEQFVNELNRDLAASRSLPPSGGANTVHTEPPRDKGAVVTGGASAPYDSSAAPQPAPAAAGGFDAQGAEKFLQRHYNVALAMGDTREPERVHVSGWLNLVTMAKELSELGAGIAASGTQRVTAEMIIKADNRTGSTHMTDREAWGRLMAEQLEGL